MKIPRLSKADLDWLGTILGAIAGISGVLVAQGWMDERVGLTIGGISTVLLGVVVQKPATRV